MSLRWLTLTALLAACQAPPVTTDARMVSQVEGFERAPDRNGWAVFVRHDAATLGSYEEFIVDPVVVHLDEPPPAALGEDMDRLASLLREAVVEALDDAGYPVVAEAGADVLRIRLFIQGIEVGPWHPSPENPDYLAAELDIDSVTLEGQLIDSADERIDFVVFSPGITGASYRAQEVLTHWSAASAAFQRWAHGFASAVEDAHAFRDDLEDWIAEHHAEQFGPGR